MWSTRRLVLLCSFGLACTRPNPAFDDLAAGGSETTGGGGTSESGTDTRDLPDDPLTCEFGPTPGLALAFGNPDYFGGSCPAGVDVWAQITEATGGEATLAVCAEGCTGCVGEHKLSAFPLSITDYLPPPSNDGCVYVQAKKPVGMETERCFWGAISVYDPDFEWPYVIATAHSSPPTSYGAEILGELIPEPEVGGACNCEAIGIGDQCCYAAEPPEFFYYPFAGMHMYPGSYAQIRLPTQAAFPYYFKVFQAERVPTCETGDVRQTSWAVVAEL